MDVRYALRTLRKSPGFTAVAVLTLALGIGANTAIFSLVNGILVVPLTYRNPSELVSVTGSYPKGAFVAMREQIRTMDVATYAEGHEFNLTGFGEPVRLTGTMVSAELFSVLGANPELGRTFRSGEDLAGEDQYVILSHALWQQRFAGDPAIVGRVIDLEGVSRQVVGVMSASFRFPSPKTQVWIPLHNDPRNATAFWADDFMPVIGRLHEDSTIPQARAEVRMFQSRVFSLFPWPMPASWNADVSVIPLQEGMVADVRSRLLMLLGAVAVVLLIACANVANLTLSRAAAREREMAIRSSLGAARLRITRQLLTESVLLASFGGSLGLLFAAKGLHLLRAVLPADTPRLGDVHVDWRVLIFTAALAILTGFVFGLAPALHSSRAAIAESLKSGGRGGASAIPERFRNSLAIAEVGLAVLLVISAGLLIRSFWALSHVDPGFQSEHIFTARISPNESFCLDVDRCLTFYRSVLHQVESSPGVSGVALVNTPPLGGRVCKHAVAIGDRVVSATDLIPIFWLDIVSPAYFRTMDIRLLAGREFAEADASGKFPVAIVTATTARQYWPNQSAVGKHLRLVGAKDQSKDAYTVVGVVADVRAYSLQRNEPGWMNGTVYVPYSPKATLEDGQVPAEMTIAVRTTIDDSQVGAIVRRAVGSLSHEVPVTELQPMHAVVSEAASTPASTTSLFVAFAGLALVLGLIGIYGVISFLVSKRTREIGIRLALGAQRRDVLWLVMKQGAKFSLTGVALGLAAAFAVSRLLAGELYGVSPLDPVTYVAVAVAMTVVTLLACYIPTRRAMRVDPLIALRYE